MLKKPRKNIACFLRGFLMMVEYSLEEYSIFIRIPLEDRLS